MCGLAESDSHTIPSGIVDHSIVMEVVAGFLTRHLDHLVTTTDYADFRKTSSISIVLSEFSHCQSLHTDILESLEVPVCYTEIALLA